VFRTIAWDQGKEMLRHAALASAVGTAVYFCDPHRPWQRGSNENTNDLLQKHIPKGTDLRVHSGYDPARFARSRNNRPRKVLGLMKPSEKLAELPARTGLNPPCQGSAGVGPRRWACVRSQDMVDGRTP